MTVPRTRGEAAWHAGVEDRFALACQLAGILAEIGVKELTFADPRACRTWTVQTRESDLPRLICESSPGTTMVGASVEVLLLEDRVAWLADEHVGVELARLAQSTGG